MQTEIKNSKEWPNLFSCNFLEDGIVSYEDMEAGIAYLSNEAIERMAQSFIGKPVCIKHQKINPDNYEQLRRDGTIVGNVTRVWKNPEDGWWWCDFIVDTEEGRKRVLEYKDKVSCAYTVLDTKEGGVWHNIPYDVEVLEGSFTHLALVGNPRYEDSKITQPIPNMLLVNEKSAFIVKNKEDKEMFEFLTKNKNGSKEKQEIFVLVNDKETPLGDVMKQLVEAVNSKAAPAANTQEFDIAGKKFTLAEIIEGFTAYNEKKNAKEHKNCNCDAKGDEMHNEKCPMYENKNDVDDKDDKDDKKGTTADDKEMKNSKEKVKQMSEFFNELETLANSVQPSEELPNAPAPRSRSERAKLFSNKVKADMSR